MNIFTLDESPHNAAIWQHDRHVVKMTLESCQMLSTAIHLHEPYRAAYDATYSDSVRAANGPDSGTPRLYKATHPNHPCNIWLRESTANFFWLTAHLNALIGEYHRRFQKPHGCDVVRWTMNHVCATLAGVDRYFTRDSNRNLIVDPAIVARYAQPTPFAVCMPDEFKSKSPVLSYRKLYVESKIFQDHVKWTRCDSLPPFMAIQPHDSFGLGFPPHVVKRIRDLEAAIVSQRAAPRLERVVAKPHVPAGFGIPSFLRRSI